MPYDKDLHFTDREFEEKYKKAKIEDFKLGMKYFKKERFHERFFGRLVILPQTLVQAAVTFSDDVNSGLAYIEVEKKVEVKVEEPKEKEVLKSAAIPVIKEVVSTEPTPKPEEQVEENKNPDPKAETDTKPSAKKKVGK